MLVAQIDDIVTLVCARHEHFDQQAAVFLNCNSWLIPLLLIKRLFCNSSCYGTHVRVMAPATQAG